ncbi:hypothetical protein [Oceanisphaera profunda]|uniref:hypothetical protein n=1 Tax=Oceanisphaera profunda TaxID=1416627 RepID=UPI001D130A1E|nr:hypothetical protein [Oceanisphaera profunda]
MANYTTYRSYYEIEKSILDNPEFDTQKSQKKLRAFVERSKESINTKAEIMLEHFIPQIVNKKKLQGNPFKVLVAFSGSKEVDGIEYTEAEINGFGESETAKQFDSDEYRLLVLALNKDKGVSLESIISRLDAE